MVQASAVVFDHAGHFEKMSYRNRYRISGANNTILLSIPLLSGRDQRLPMTEVRISNQENWQVQHWRALTSAYKRAPFWEYYEPGLQQIFETRYTHLKDFNMATTAWVVQQLKLRPTISETNVYTEKYEATVTDLRRIKPSDERKAAGSFPKYYQVFEDRIGFIPNLSIIDLLCSEGPQSAAWLASNYALLTDNGKFL